MGWCCLGSSDEEGSDVKEVAKKDSVKEGSAAQANRVTRVNSGEKIVFCWFFWKNFSGFLCFWIFGYRVGFVYVEFCVFFGFVYGFL